MNVLEEQLAKYPMADSLARYGAIKLACIPDKLDGKRVLDIGGYDGRFAAECLQRGAATAVCLESQEWKHYMRGTWPEPGTFEGVEYQEGDFLEHQDVYDLVLCFNVLYHCARWQTAADALRRLTSDTLCISTYWAVGSQGWNEYVEMGTNFHRATPTIPGLFQELGQAGFSDFPYIQTKDELVVMRCR